MIVPDVNLLLYAVISGFPQHRRAHEWWQQAINGPNRIGLTQPAVFGFLRIVTNARIMTSPLPVADAIVYVRDWLAQPNVVLLVPAADHLNVALGLLEDLGTAGNLTTDVQLAAYALQHDSVVYSNDTDCARFPRVKWVNPL